MRDVASRADRSGPLLGLDELPPWHLALPLGLQHLVVMLLGTVTPALLIAGALGLDGEETTGLVQAALLLSGLATLVQSYPIGPVGGRIPIVMGTSIAFVGAAIAIGREYGLATVFGACLVAAAVEVGAGFSIRRLRRLFPPLVTGIVVMLIGLLLIPVGMDYAAGGVGAEDYGAPIHLGLAALVLVTSLLLNRFAPGFWSSSSILLGVLVGWVAAALLGRAELGAVAAAGWISPPRLLPFGLEIHWAPILLMAAIYLISAIETIGDISGVLAADGRQPTASELRGGLVADGTMSAVASLLGSFPNTSYSQNVGVVNFTGIVSRHVTAICGLFLVALGLVPKIGALFSSLPPAVLGGAALILFAMIFSSGVSILLRADELTQRDLVILAVAVALGLGVELRPQALASLPDGLRTLFGSGLVAGGLAAVAMHRLFPQRRDG